MSAPAAMVLPMPSSGSAASRRHLLGRLTGVEARVRTAVSRRRATDPNPDDGFRGLYITHEQVDVLLGGPQPLDSADTQASQWLAEVEADAVAAVAGGVDIRLHRLARAFDLDSLDIEILLIALAPDLDARFERLYGYLHDDVSRRRASIGLSLELCGTSPTVVHGRTRFAERSPLIEGRLVLVEDRDRPYLTRSLRVPDRVTSYLLGDDTVEPSLVAVASARVERGALVGEADRALHSHTNPSSLGYIRDCAASAGLALAIAQAGAQRPVVLVLDLEHLSPEADVLELSRTAAREALLLGAGVVAAPIDALITRGPAAVRALAQLPCPTVLMGTLPWDPAWSRRIPLVSHAGRLSATDRARLWSEQLPGVGADVHPDAVTAAYRLSADQIRRAAEAARLTADAAGRSVEAADIRLGARSQNAAGLDKLARRIEPAVRLADLVLADEQMELLRDLIARAQHRKTVLDGWAVGGTTATRRGLTALFAGPSGTGKTMAAEVIAAELGLELCAVDLATVVDKYIGETEKNLDRIFRESERVNCVLLFDEADALFGKRSDVSDAHDRYANVETAYLLQRMEQFEGIAVLATNLRANLDEAFTRRLDVIVDFTEPDEQHRLLLWERCLGTRVPRGPDIDLSFMARTFELSGGNIRNVAIAAAFMAADRGGVIGMSELVHATEREYRKLGRLSPEATDQTTACG